MTHISHLSFLQLVRLFGIWFVAQSILLAIVSVALPGQIVLGTNTISPLSAVFNSMLTLTLFAVGAIPLLEIIQDTRKVILSKTQWMLFYFAVNAAGLWVISRFAEQIGLGLASWFVAAFLGALMTLLQGFFAMRLGSE